MDDLKRTKIAFIGSGNMGEALMRGLVGPGALPAANIRASDPSPGRLAILQERYGIVGQSDNSAVAAWADVVVLAVKPQILPIVLAPLGPSIADSLVISVAAGTSCATIEGALGQGVRVVRAMPNTPALVSAGATVLAAGTHATVADMALARHIFDCVGITEVLAETDMDAVTGLSGSGPAYVFLMLEALTDAGVRVGLSRRISLRLAAQTVMGSAKLLLDTDGHPGQLKDMVTSPGGTAIAGLHTLEEGGLRTTLMNAVQAATERARQLGQRE